MYVPPPICISLPVLCSCILFSVIRTLLVFWLCNCIYEAGIKSATTIDFRHSSSYNLTSVMTMDEKDLMIDTETVEDNEPLLGQITFDELLAELRLG